MYFVKALIYILSFICLFDKSNSVSIIKSVKIGWQELEEILQEMNYEGVHFHCHYFHMYVGEDGKTIHIDINYNSTAKEL